MKTFPLISKSMGNFLWKGIAAVLMTLLLLAGLPVGQAHAAGLVVTTANDVDNGSDGACSLREAIIAANTDVARNECPAGSGADTITFSVGGAVSITLHSSLPTITKDMTIDGGSLISLDGFNAYRILRVDSGLLTLQGISLVNGSVTGNGGAIWNNGATVHINQSFFIGNRVTGNGGAIYNNGVMDIHNTSFSNNGATNAVTTAVAGGAIYNVTNGNLSIDGSVFDNNFAHNSTGAGSGGAIYSGAGTFLTVENTLFGNSIANTAGNGGAIYVAGTAASPATVTLGTSTGNTFTSNHAANNAGAGSGGAVYLNNATATITNGAFNQNSAGSNGGAVYNNGDLTVHGTDFISNQATNITGGGVNGGAIFNAADRSLIIDGTTNQVVFNSNGAWNTDGEGNGGAIYSGAGTTLTVTEADFGDSGAGNYARNGGAIFITGGATGATVHLTSVDFTYNTADDSHGTIPAGLGNGGAIYTTNASLTLDLCDFGYNTSGTGGGGAITSTGNSTVIITNAATTGFANNTTTGAGGAYNNNGTAANVFITGGFFNNNQAGTSGGALDGGGMGATGSSINLTSVDVTNNHAGTNGGAVNTGAVLDIDGGNFSSNTAGDNGGAINTTGSAVTDIFGAAFSSNMSGTGDGGAIRATSALTVDSSTFYSNTAGTVTVGYGGGLYYSTNTGTVINSSFVGNIARSSGGAIYSGGGTLDLGNDTLANNQALGGSDVADTAAMKGAGAIRLANAGAVVNVYNVTISGNTAINPGYGSQIRSSAGTLTFANSIVSGVATPNCFVAGTGVITDGGNNIELDASASPTCWSGSAVDPLLGSLTVTAPYYFPLQATSPAIDAGNATVCSGAVVDQVDQIGTTRPVGLGCDIGAIELNDTTPPETYIDSANPAATTTTLTTMDIIFHGTDSESGVKSYECRLDTPSGPGSYGACISPQNLTGLTTDGTYTFFVRSIDYVGNVDASPAEHTWTVDTSNPVVTITNVSPNPTNDGATVTWNANEDGTFEVRVGGTDCTTGVVVASGSYTSSTGNTGTVIASSDLPVGLNHLWVCVSDASANTGSDDDYVTKDTTSPTVTIANVSPDPTNTGTTVTWNADEDGTFEVRVGGTDCTTGVVVASGSYTSSTGNTGTVIASSDLSVGLNSLWVCVTDAATNTGSDDSSVTKETASPVVTIDNVDPNPTNGGTAITWHADKNGTYSVRVGGTDCTTGTEVDSGPYTTSPAAVVSPVPAGSLVAGGNILRVCITDAATNIGSASSTVGKDVSYPIVIYGTRNIPSEGGVFHSGPHQLVIEFNKNLLNDGSVGAVNNPINFLLVEQGFDKAFDTLSCEGGLKSDDIPFSVDSVIFDNNSGAGPFLATLNINSGNPLPKGTYRLFICGTKSIHDTAGNILNNGASDSLLNFTVLLGVQARPIGGLNTGFAPNRVTVLQSQTVSYEDLGDLWLEIPALGLKTPIVGIPQVDGEYDVSWLGKDAGWLNGSAFPTWAGNSVITGHVYGPTGNPGPFEGLNRLWYGSQVIVHAWGGQYVYAVRAVMQVGPNDMATIMKHQELPWLTLVTCRGYDQASNSYKYRVLVRAVLVEVK